MSTSARALAACLILCAAALSACATSENAKREARLAPHECNEARDKGLWNYEGTVGDSPVRMTFVFDGDRIFGTYYRADQLKDISFTGTLVDRSRITLDELSASGKTVARFELGYMKVVDDVPRPPGVVSGGCNIISGRWHKVRSDQVLPVRIEWVDTNEGSLAHRYAAVGANDDDLINRRVLAFCDAIARNDRNAVAYSFAYPAKVDGRLLKDPEALLSSYDSIFSPQVREVISNALPRNLGSMNNGIYLKHGSVWFNSEGKVMAVNTGQAKSEWYRLRSP
jgi:hypothetical protein